jgi:hypothetical protein
MFNRLAGHGFQLGNLLGGGGQQRGTKGHYLLGSRQLQPSCVKELCRIQRHGDMVGTVFAVETVRRKKTMTFKLQIS